MSLGLPARLEELLTPVLWCGCWLFNGRWQSRNGYGRLSWEGKQTVIHRVVWEILRGPIPDGLALDHLCRVTACANPDHLEPVTVSVNTLRGDAVLFRPLCALA